MKAQGESANEPDVPVPGSWSEPLFTAPIRGVGHRSLADTAERRLHEGSLGFRGVKFASRVPGVRRVVGAVPPSIGSSGGDSTAPDVALLHTPLYRRLQRFRGTAMYDRLWRLG